MASPSAVLRVRPAACGTRKGVTHHERSTMSEPSSGVPGEIADAEVEAPTSDEPTTVELELDQEKIEAWDEVKGDYQVEPDGQPVANSLDGSDLDSDDATADDTTADATADDTPAPEADAEQS